MKLIIFALVTVVVRKLVVDGQTAGPITNGTTARPFFPKDCNEIYVAGQEASGQYDIYIEGHRRPTSVFCDMQTAGGSWTVIQRRLHGVVSFCRQFGDYVEGFGDNRHEFWIGNRYINLLTTNGNNELRIDMRTFNGTNVFAAYDKFRVAGANQNYNLTSVGNYRGSAGGDSFVWHELAPFSTPEQDNGPRGNINFAADTCSGWWFGTGGVFANLNGQYFPGGNATYNNGIMWEDLTGEYGSLAFSEMKVRPSDILKRRK